MVVLRAAEQGRSGHVIYAIVLIGLALARSFVPSKQIISIKSWSSLCCLVHTDGQLTDHRPHKAPQVRTVASNGTASKPGRCMPACRRCARNKGTNDLPGPARLRFDATLSAGGAANPQCPGTWRSGGR